MNKKPKPFVNIPKTMTPIKKPTMVAEINLFAFIFFLILLIHLMKVLLIFLFHTCYNYIILFFISSINY